MKRTSILGYMGGISSVLMGLLVFFVMLIGQLNGVSVDLTIEMYLAFIAGAIGIVGAVVSGKRGGVILIVSGILVLIAISSFGIFPFILLIVGGTLSLREKEPPVVESVTKNISDAQKKKKFRDNLLVYLAIIGVIIAVVVPFGVINYQNYLQPRAKLTVYFGSITFAYSSSSNISIRIPVTVSNYSPRTANIIKDWNLTVTFMDNSRFEYPIKNCTYGTRILEPAQQTEFLFSYDFTNTPIHTEVHSVHFIISYIDDQGTRTQGFEVIYH